MKTVKLLQHILPRVRPLLALAVALLLGAVIIAVIQHDLKAPLIAYYSLFVGAFGSPNGVANTLRLTMPLLLTGVAVMLALAAGRFNIGAEGQVAVGALVAAIVGAIRGIPSPLILPLALGGAALAGAMWAILPALLRERRGVHEVITSLLLNYVAQNVTHFLATGILKDPTGQAPQTAEVVATLPRLHPNYDVHFGILIALILTILTCFGLFLTVWGYETRAVGLGIRAAQVVGIPSARRRIQAFLVSGALCGIAGGVTVLGEAPFRRFPADFYGIGYGFDGLAVALLVAGAVFPRSIWSALGILPSALIFGALSAGAEAMAFDTSTPKQIIAVVQAILIVAIAARKAEQ